MSTIIQRSFASGEIAPALYARVDFFKYQTGLRTCRNNFIMRHGGATNRAGTKYVAPSPTLGNVRLIPFIFSVDQTFVLEFGGGAVVGQPAYMRPYKNGAPILQASQNITNVTSGPGLTIHINAHGYVANDWVYIDGVVGPDIINKRYWCVQTASTNSFTVGEIAGGGAFIPPIGFPSYVSGGTARRVYQITTSYTNAQLPFLKYAQSADTLTIAHPSHLPTEIQRVSDTNWTIGTIQLFPQLAAPVMGAVTGGPTGTRTFNYRATSIKSEDYEESLLATPSGTITNKDTPTVADPITVNFSNVTGAVEYNIYRLTNSIWGLIGVSGGTSFQDIGLQPDTTKTPPITRNPFANLNSRPSCVTYYQQRLVFAGSNNNPDRVWTSRTGLFKNFTIRSPLQEDDAITFTLAGRQINPIKHLVDIGKLIIFTATGEWVAEGGDGGVLTTTAINLKQQSYNGSTDLAPIIIGNSCLYVQARGSIVRDLGFDFSVDGYQGNDLTIFSAHLFDNFTLTDWTYQQVPHSVVWVARSDGTLLALTYVKDQGLLAWSRHDLGMGDVLSVCVVPEGNEDALYLAVRERGGSRIYIERMSTREFTDIKNATFLDSFVTYDGRNTAATNITLTGGTDWDYEETLTATATASIFAASNVGQELHLIGADGSLVRFEILGFTSGTVVTGKPKTTVPVSLRGTSTANWARAVKVVDGLHHLEGKDVSVFADGFVVANPNNDSYTTVTVTNGKVTLDKAYGVIHVGLPYICDIETLNIDTTQAETLVDKNKLSQEVHIWVEETRGLWVGPEPAPDSDPLEGLTEIKARATENYQSPIEQKTDVMQVNFGGRWNNNGRVFIRQVDPVPMSILAVAPSGLYPIGGR